MLGRHHRGAVMSLLSNAALGLLRGECQLWRNKEPLTGRSQRLCAARPSSSHPMHNFGKALLAHRTIAKPEKSVGGEPVEPSADSRNPSFDRLRTNG